MSLEDLRAFLAVARHGSFLGAAVSLGVSRTTLRRHVGALEAQAGIALFRRAANGVLLTEAGRALADGGEKIEDDFAGLLRTVRAAPSRPAGEVNVLIQVGLEPRLVAMVYDRFLEAWPDVRARVCSCDSPLALAQPGVDVIAWMGDSHPGPTWVAYTVLTLRQRVLATREYLDAHGTPRTIDDLAGHPLIAWLEPGRTDVRVTDRTGYSVALKPIATSNDAHMLHVLARHGLALVYAPDGGLPDAVGETPLVAVLDDVIVAPIELRAAVPQALAAVPRVKVVIEGMRAVRDAVAAGLF